MNIFFSNCVLYTLIWGVLFHGFSIVYAQELILKENESYQICEEELKIHQLFVHKGITYVDINTEKNQNILSLNIGEKIHYLPCDAYIANIRKVGSKPATCAIKLSKPEIKTLVYLPEFELNIGKLYEVDKVKIEWLETKNESFLLQLQLEEQHWYPLKSFLWLGGSMYQITEFENNKLTFRRLQEFIITSQDTLFSHTPVFTEDSRKNEFAPIESLYEYRIVYISDIHCAKSSQKCNLCVIAAQDFRWRLVKKYIGTVYFSAPIMEFTEGNKKTFASFSIIQSFKNETEAEKYSSEHDIIIEKPEEWR